jgi:PAS domain S-box-containing protein
MATAKHPALSVLKTQKKLPLFVLDSKGLILGSNEAFAKLCGFRQKELVGKKYSFAFSKVPMRQFDSLLKECKEKKIASHDFVFTAKKDLSFECRITLIDQDRHTSFIGLVQKVDNIDRLKEEIDAVNRIADHNLKKLVKTNEKLHEARRAEQEALSTKEKFLTNISHELRTPLTGISGITQLLAKTRLNPQQKKYVDSILHSADSLVSIINELLDLSKIRSGKFELELEEFSLFDCIKNSASAFSIISTNKNITFNFSYDKKIPPILIGDSLRISQIVNNLLNNAFKFTHDGYIHLNVMLKKTENNISYVDFEVSDTGIGIEKEKLRSIFDEFKQAEAGTSRLYGGTGLGLSICQHLVKLQNGTIDVQSKKGKGSSFYFTLPLPVGKKIKHADVKPGERLKGSRILVADDNMVNVLVIENILKKEGVHVVTAADGKEAYTQFKKMPIDLILLDLNMPRMDGFELARLLRKKEKTDLPIIAVTAANPDSVQKKCSDSGFTDIIFKPFRNEDFVFRLEKFLKREKKTEGERELVKVTQEKNDNQTAGPDFSTIDSIAGGEAAIFNDLLKSIIDNIREEVPKLKDAVDKKDYKTIYFLSHKLKTSYGYVGLQKELKALKKMETLSEGKQGLEEIITLYQPVFKSHGSLLKLLNSSFR